MYTGLDILKIILCFTVVWDHFGDHAAPEAYAHGLSMLGASAVPCFMLMTFFLNRGTFADGNRKKFFLRIKNLLLVFIVWAVISALYAFVAGESSIPEAFLLQILAGGPLNPPMWFHAVLIWITILFGVISFLFTKRTGMILWIVFAATLWMQYAGMHVSLTEGGVPQEMRYTAGRFIEMLPVACTGFLAGGSTLLKKNLKDHWIVTMLVSGCALVFLAVFDVFTLPAGFGYQGLSQLCKSILLVLFFYALPDRFLPEHASGAMRFAASCTLHVYCMHYLVGKIFMRMIPAMRSGLQMTLAVFVVSALFALAFRFVYIRMQKH